MTERAKNEIVKENSRLLRGGIADGLTHVETGAIDEDDTMLLKFHGSYMQDDRDVRAERTKKKLEKAFSFMIRLRLPGGVVTPEQWLKLDDIAGTYANGTLRLTTRATFQYHGVIKSNLKRTMQAINAACIDTIAACGDVNRNVMSASHPFLSKAHKEAEKLAIAFSDHLLPRTGAYHEIWLDDQKVIDTSAATEESEPIYGPLYLPRKFKTVVAVPPDNDVDIFAHCLGYIAIVEKGEVVGWNVTVGGGMGMTHGETDTFPRTADMLGFCTPEQAIDVGEKVVTVQRDWGNRAVRKNARLKYTIERVGIDAFRAEVEKRCGYKLGAPRPFTFTSTGDPIGWRQTLDGKAADKKWHLTLYVENGRVKDTATREDADGAARDRAGGRRRLRRDVEPEPRHRQCDGEAEAEDRGAAGEAWRRDRDVVGAAAQRDGVRGAADVRAGAGRERALPAGPRDGAGRHPRRGGSARGRHRHPHDRLPERLRAAVSGGDRVRGAVARALQPVSRRGVRRDAAVEDLCAGCEPGADPEAAGADHQAVSRKSGPRASTSATSSCAPASSLRRRRAITSTRTSCWRRCEPRHDARAERAPLRNRRR